MKVIKQCRFLLPGPLRVKMFNQQQQQFHQLMQLQQLLQQQQQLPVQSMPPPVQHQQPQQMLNLTAANQARLMNTHPVLQRALLMQQMQGKSTCPLQFLSLPLSVIDPILLRDCVTFAQLVPGSSLAGNLRGLGMGAPPMPHFFSAAARQSILGTPPMGVNVKAPRMAFPGLPFQQHHRMFQKVRGLDVDSEAAQYTNQAVFNPPIDSAQSILYATSSIYSDSICVLQAFQSHLVTARHHLKLKEIQKLSSVCLVTLMPAANDGQGMAAGIDAKKHMRWCNVCQIHFSSDLIEHRRTREHKLAKHSLRPFCTVCSRHFKTPRKFVEHMKSPEHKQKTQEPWTLEETDELITVDAVGCFEEEDDNEEEEEEGISEDDASGATECVSVSVLPADFIVPVEGYLCRLCHKFYPSDSAARLSHCKSLTHYQNVQVRPFCCGVVLALSVLCCLRHLTHVVVFSLTLIIHPSFVLSLRFSPVLLYVLSERRIPCISYISRKD
uniref:Matrin-type domain-containing protein n=1 Tax=Leptobrachium leishanense TaxID=445787 RepID=A0A8C5WDS4_9ANUR